MRSTSIATLSSSCSIRPTRSATELSPRGRALRLRPKKYAPAIAAPSSPVTMIVPIKPVSNTIVSLSMSASIAGTYTHLPTLRRCEVSSFDSGTARTASGVRPGT